MLLCLYLWACPLRPALGANAYAQGACGRVLSGLPIGAVLTHQPPLGGCPFARSRTPPLNTTQDKIMSDILYNRTLELLLDAFRTAKTGGLVNQHSRNFYQKIDPLLSADLKSQLQQSPEAPETEAKLRLELDLLFQRQVFSIHAAMFVKDYEDNC